MAGDEVIAKTPSRLRPVLSPVRAIPSPRSLARSG